MTTLYLLPFVLLFLIAVPILYSNYREYKIHKNSSYRQQTGYSYLQTLFDKGKYGEFLTYLRLQSWEHEGAKFLYNVYLPKESGGTTEIDLLLITRKGIFVFESKNYSGWIYGNEQQNQWTQTLRSGHKTIKNHFYNPIMQNHGHIKHLQCLIGTSIPMYSIIVFSERCTLKNISTYSPNIRVIKRTRIADAVNSVVQESNFDFIDDEQINIIYNQLLPYSQVTDKIKQQHIDNIKNH